MNNFDTIREALELATPHYQADTARFAAALAALTAIEADHYSAADMADAQAKAFRAGVASVTAGQEPVAWLVCSVNSDDSLSLEHAAAWKEAAHEHINDAITEHGIEDAASWVVRPAYVAAPVAQQPQNWQPVTESDLAQVEAWLMTPASAMLPADQTHLMNLTTHMIREVRATRAAQQPQARPDFSDEWTGYLKDGETPFERFLRERKDVQSVLKLYQRALDENERLQGQQPQAEAVRWERKNDAGRWVNVPMGDEQFWSRFGSEMRVKAPQQAEAVHHKPVRVCHIKDVACSEAAVKCGECPDAAPQQAEAVPSDVVRDAERWRTFLATRPANTHAVINDAIDAAMAKGEKS